MPGIAQERSINLLHCGSGCPCAVYLIIRRSGLIVPFIGTLYMFVFNYIYSHVSKNTNPRFYSMGQPAPKALRSTVK